MSDFETPWADSEGNGVPQWFDSSPFASGAEQPVWQPQVEQPGAAETHDTEAREVRDRTDESSPDSLFETPVEGFADGFTGAWADSAREVETLIDSEVPGCGGPATGTPPLIYRTSRLDRSRTPWVG